MAILKHKENGSWVEVPLGTSTGFEVSDTQPTNPMTQVWVDTTQTNIIVDYVVEQSYDNNWFYRKWNSGRVECYGHVSLGSKAITTADGNLYHASADVINFPSNLFITTPWVTTSSHINDSGGSFFSISNIITSGIGGYVYAGKSMTKNVILNICAIGRWK